MNPPELPEGWMLDPAITEHRPEIGVWWVITDTGLRTAWNAEQNPNANGQVCPACSAHPDRIIECQDCRGRGVMDSVPYCDRPWDEITPGLWLGGIHCQFGAKDAPDGNAFPKNRFGTVVSLLNAPGYEPGINTDHFTFRIADADLDPEHHTHLDDLASLVETRVQSGQQVLVRCQAGINRSALLVGLVLLRNGWTLDDYLTHVRAVRSPYVLFNRSFVAYLREVEAR